MVREAIDEVSQLEGGLQEALNEAVVEVKRSVSA